MCIEIGNITPYCTNTILFIYVKYDIRILSRNEKGEHDASNR
jgi:hypothetical protein